MCPAVLSCLKHIDNIIWQGIVEIRRDFELSNCRAWHPRGRFRDRRYQASYRLTSFCNQYLFACTYARQQLRKYGFRFIYRYGYGHCGHSIMIHSVLRPQYNLGQDDGQALHPHIPSNASFSLDVHQSSSRMG